MKGNSFLVKIELGSIQQLVEFQRSIPEFERQTSEQEYAERLMSCRSLVLVAKTNDEVIGIKVGYEENDEVFYSWIGGVKPENRGNGVALSLLKYQEKWVVQNGFKRIRVNTYNKYGPMICMLINNNYQLVDFEQHSDIQRNKLTFEKVMCNS